MNTRKRGCTHGRTGQKQLVNSFCKPHSLYATECLRLSHTAIIKLKSAWFCALSTTFHVKGSNVDFISEMCEWYCFVTEVANRQDRFCRVSYDELSSVYYPAPGTGTGYCFPAISFFLSLFVSLLATLWENGWTDLHEIFRDGGSDHGMTWLNFGSIWVNGSAGQGQFVLSKLQPVELDISFALTWWQHFLSMAADSSEDWR